MMRKAPERRKAADMAVFYAHAQDFAHEHNPLRRNDRRDLHRQRHITLMCESL